MLSTFQTPQQYQAEAHPVLSLSLLGLALIFSTQIVMTQNLRLHHGSLGHNNFWGSHMKVFLHALILWFC